jgi:diguanylate cyclase (GGDEF)-like protein
MNRDATDSLLLLEDDDLGQGLVESLKDYQPTCIADPYEAIRRQAEQPHRAVLLPGPRDELGELARAMRRLGPRSRVLACCHPEDIPTVRQFAGEDLDDVLPLPLSRGEVTCLLRSAGSQHPPHVNLNDLASLVSATHKLPLLEQCIADLVSRQFKREVTWVGAEDQADDHVVLLHLPGQSGRRLVVRGPVPPDESRDAVLGDLHRLLPTLRGVAQRIDSLHRLAITDHLTGAYNRRYFYHLVDHVLHRAQREGFRAALLLYDIDDFKQYNDRYGHATGDEILRDTARLIQEITRDQDIVARIGGDEFAVLFWDEEIRSPQSEPLSDAWDLADRFRQAVESHLFQSLGPQAKGSLTISGGLSSFPEHGQNCLELLRQADRALRSAKTEGKNAVHLVGQP